MGMMDIFKKKAAKRRDDASPAAASPDGDRSKQIIAPALELDLPDGWVELPNAGGPRTYAPRPDGSAGVLQVSRLPEKDYAFVAGQAHLGAFAAETASRLGWGAATASEDATCTMGRMGRTVFDGGQFPAMRMLVTVSPSGAYMWTWIGPSPDADEVEQALAIAAGAREAALPATPGLVELVEALEGISLVHGLLLAGDSPEQLHLAVLTDAQLNVSGDERPVLSGRFSVVDSQDLPEGEKRVLMETRFDADQSRTFTVSVRVKAEAEGTDDDDEDPVEVCIVRDELAGPSHAARLRAAQLWSLTGEQIDAAYEPATYQAVVLGTRLAKNRVPANFEKPGEGSWVLLQITEPDDLYVAFDTSAGIIELFPKTPMEPNDAARALFRSL